MADVPQQRKDQIHDLINQWEQLMGYPSGEIPQWMLDNMYTWSGGGSAYVAGHTINSLFDVGQYLSAMADNPGPGGDAKPSPFSRGLIDSRPWASFGLTNSEYQTAFKSMEEVWNSLTGDALGGAEFQSQLRLRGGSLGASQYRSLLMHDQKLLQTYGWLRYGMDYSQFQQRKLELEGQFGKPLDNQQAILQLQYSHQASADHSASVVPTLTQQEKKSAEVGTSFSQVR